MATLDEILHRIISTRNLSHHQTLTSWQIDLPRRGRFTCQLDVGPDALEWWLTVYDQVDGKEVWKDWMDYLGYHNGKTEAELIEDKGCDISTFIEAWLRATDARITRIKTKFFFNIFHITNTELELFLENQWVVAPLDDLSRY